MATTPPKPPNQTHPTNPPPPPPGNVVPHSGAHPQVGLHPGQVIGVKGEPIDDGERDPDTIAEEQRKRSDDMDKVGMAKWIADHDERKGEAAAAPRQVTATVKIEGSKAP